MIRTTDQIPSQMLVEFFDRLPVDEKLVADMLRQIILEYLPAGCRERMAYHVPFYYGKKRICLIWPASVKGGGVKSGVLLGFCQGFRLEDPQRFLEHGSNKRVYYRIYHSPEEIDERSVTALLKEAVLFDGIA